jgi:hypothetical protein
MDMMTVFSQQAGQVYLAQIAAQDPEVQNIFHGEVLPVIVAPDYAGKM